MHLTECRVSFAAVHCSLSRSRVSARSHGVSLRNRKFIQKFRNYKSVRMFRESEITPPTTVACIEYKVGRRAGRGGGGGGKTGCRLRRCQLQITVLKIRSHENDLTMCKTYVAVKVSPSRRITNRVYPFVYHVSFLNFFSIFFFELIAYSCLGGKSKYV